MFVAWTKRLAAAEAEEERREAEFLARQPETSALGGHARSSSRAGQFRSALRPGRTREDPGRLSRRRPRPRT